MRYVRVWVALTAPLWAGCAPLYPVQIAPIGPDTYIATQTSLFSWLDARTAALQRAAAWCAHKGGQFAAFYSDRVKRCGRRLFIFSARSTIAGLGVADPILARAMVAANLLSRVDKFVRSISQTGALS